MSEKLRGIFLTRNVAYSTSDRLRFLITRASLSPFSNLASNFDADALKIYCNCVLYGTSQRNLDKLQRVQTAECSGASYCAGAMVSQRHL